MTIRSAYSNSESRVSSARIEARSVAKVIVYTGENCPACKTLLKYLNDKAIRYMIKDTGKESVAKELFAETGFSSIPVTVVLNGDRTVIKGFDKKRLSKLLEE